MLAGINSFNTGFIADLTQIENRIGLENQQISSGIRVSEASDDPGAVGPILEYQNEIDRINQAQTNLNGASTEATAADQALQSAATLMDQLVSIASQGASSSTTAQTRATLGSQVQQIQQQLVNLANTTVQGHYVFGGDDPTTQPYTYDWTSSKGVDQNVTTTNTSILRNAAGDSIVPRLTAQGIFDLQNPDGTSASGNVFQAVYDLGQALLNNDQAGAQTAVSELQAAGSQIGTASSFYGGVEDWIQQSNQDSAQRLTSLQQALTSVKDTDIPTAAIALTTDQTALQAALSAHGTMDNRSLFSYIG